MKINPLENLTHEIVSTKICTFTVGHYYCVDLINTIQAEIFAISNSSLMLLSKEN